MRWEFIFDIIFPNTCVGCGTGNTLLCSACAAYLARPLQTCPVCGHTSELGLCHEACREYAVAMLCPVQIFSALSYHDPVVQAAIHELKYQGIRGYAGIFAGILADSAGCTLEPGTTITAVPLHARRHAERGFNQSELIAKALAVQTGCHYEQLLTKTKHTKSQTALSGNERRSQLTGAFSCKENLTGQHVILVDDVYTTGSTLAECTRALYAAGAASVACLTVAKD